MTTFTWPAGILTALVTPFAGDDIDVAALEALIEFQIAGGVSGLVIGGGTGEYGAMSVPERRRLAREAIRIVDGRVATVVQTGALATRDTITLSRDAQDAGATGLLVGSPFGEPINWPERLQFYRRVTSSVSMPIMIYNTPPSGILTLAELQQLAQLPHVSAVKDSSGDRVLMGDVLRWAAGTGFAVYVGLDSALYDALSAGARGAVFGAPNVEPRLLSEIARDLLTNGESSAARERWAPMREFLRFMEVSPNYMALCKAGCALNGIDVGDVREPYLMPQPGEIAELATRLTEVRARLARVGVGAA